jgi:hypothetical protein
MAKAMRSLESHAKSSSVVDRCQSQVDAGHIEMRGDLLRCLALPMGESIVTKTVMAIRGSRLIRSMSMMMLWAMPRIRARIIRSVRPVPVPVLSLSTESARMDMRGTKRVDCADQALNLVKKKGDVTM